MATPKFLSENGLLYLWQELKSIFVQKEVGKQLMTTAESQKLKNIAEGAEVNVQSDWNAVSGDGVILNKPTSLPASDVQQWAKQPNKPSYTAGEVGADSSGTAQVLVSSEALIRASADTTLDGKITALTQEVSNLNAEKILNKGIIYSTFSNVETVCNNYVQTEYSRKPQQNDAIIVTLSDRDNDKVKYVYSVFSSAWNDLGLASAEIAEATEAVKGISKLYQSLGDNADGAISQKSIKAELAKKVAVEENKGLSDENFSIEEKTKLSKLEIMSALTNEEIDNIISQ